MAAQFSLDSFPKNLLLGVMCKVPAKVLCRLRQSCSFLNKFVEDNKRRIASFPNFKGYFCVNKVELDNGRVAIEVVIDTDALLKNDRFLVESNSEDIGDYTVRSLMEIEKRTSAISFEQLLINFDSHLQDVDDEKEANYECVKEIMKIQHMCSAAVVSHDSLAHLSEIVNMIDCSGGINISAKQDENTEEFLRTMRKTRNYAKLNVSFDYCRIPRLFELIKDFHYTSIANVPNETEFLSLFWSVCKAQSHGNIAKIFVTLKKEERKLHIHNLRPQSCIKTLWDQTLIPVGKIYWFVPNYIHQIECENMRKTVLAEEKYDSYVFHFVNNSEEEVFSKLVKGIMQMEEDHLDETLREEFMTATIERKGEILRELFESYEYDDDFIGNEDHSDEEYYGSEAETEEEDDDE